MDKKWPANRRHLTTVQDIQGFDGAAQALPRQKAIPLSHFPSTGY
jgi:hypothetical protein